MPTVVIKNAQTGEVIEREMTQDEIDAAFSSTEELEAEVERIADQLTQGEERLMALAAATVDLRMADVSGMTVADVRAAFRSRVVHYLRQRRGI